MPFPAAYRTQESATWTRVEMVLALYARGIEHIEEALRARQLGNLADDVIHRTRAAAIVAAIRSGILTEYGEIPQRIDQLCEFVQSCLIDQDPTRLEVALKVMQDLHEAFEGIREEANQLEARGEIPPLSNASTIDATV